MASIGRKPPAPLAAGASCSLMRVASYMSRRIRKDTKPYQFCEVAIDRIAVAAGLALLPRVPQSKQVLLQGPGIVRDIVAEGLFQPMASIGLDGRNGVSVRGQQNSSTTIQQVSQRSPGNVRLRALFRIRSVCRCASVLTCRGACDGQDAP